MLIPVIPKVIPVLLKDGHEELVCKEELQFLLLTQKIMLFKRSDGLAVLGRNRMRNQRAPYNGEERRQHSFYSLTADLTGKSNG